MPPEQPGSDQPSVSSATLENEEEAEPRIDSHDSRVKPEDERLQSQKDDALLETVDFRGFSIWARIGIFLASFTVFLVLWQVIASLSNNSLIVSTPLPVFQALVKLLGNKIPPAATGIQLPDAAAAQTLEIILIGFGLGAVVGVPVGIVAGRWSFAESIIDPWVSATYSIPIVALIPVLYYALGGSLFADVFITFLLSVFTIIVNTQNGVKYMSSSLAEVGKSFRASEFQFLSKVVLPASLPDIVTGLRIGIGRAILGAILAEALLSENGLGGIMMTFQALYDTPYMMATVIIIAVLGIVVLQVPKALENHLFRWKESERLSRGL